MCADAEPVSSGLVHTMILIHCMIRATAALLLCLQPPMSRHCSRCSISPTCASCRCTLRRASGMPRCDPCGCQYPSRYGPAMTHSALGAIAVHLLCAVLHAEDRASCSAVCQLHAALTPRQHIQLQALSIMELLSARTKGYAGCAALLIRAAQPSLLPLAIQVVRSPAAELWPPQRRHAGNLSIHDRDTECC